jgi:hypothetical protein
MRCEPGALTLDNEVGPELANHPTTDEVTIELDRSVKIDPGHGAGGGSITPVDDATWPKVFPHSLV